MNFLVNFSRGRPRGGKIGVEDEDEAEALQKKVAEDEAETEAFMFEDETEAEDLKTAPRGLLEDEDEESRTQHWLLPCPVDLRSNVTSWQVCFCDICQVSILLFTKLCASR